jgi:hypothetical protein
VILASKDEETLTVTCAVLEQPLPSVPVTDHVVFEEGVATKELPLPDGFHTYELPPPAVNVTDSPSQIPVELAFKLIVGLLCTVIKALADAEQLFPSVPVTV